jgi:pimeloyl-ACP methyl ester carboxylesterase
VNARHRPWPLVLGGVALVLVLGWAIVSALAEPDAPPAFYTPPSRLPGAPVGTVIRSEPLDPLPDGAAVTRVLYLSSGVDGQPIAVSGIVVTPAGESPAGGWSVVAWAHGTTGIVPRCAPSLETDGGTGKIPDLEALLDAGHVVVATDYPGLGTPGIHPYLVGESEGRAVLDSIRAARSFLPDQTNDTVAIFGHSQGGHAALFAAALSPTYAPELNVVGVAPMSPPTALGELLERDIHEAQGIVLTAYAVESWARIYPDADPRDIVHVGVRGTTRRLAAQCATPDALQELVDLPYVLELKGRFLSANPEDAPGWGNRLTENSPSLTEPITMPLLISQGTIDTLVRPDVTQSYVDAQCKAGAHVELDRYPGIGHFDIRPVAPPHILEWFAERFAGDEVGGDCTTKTVESGS